MKTQSFPFVRIIAIMTACMFLCACTSLQVIPSSDIGQLAKLVQPRDTVDCTMRDGSHVTLKISSVENDTLVGKDGRRVAVSEVTGAEIKRLDSAKSILLGVAVAVGIAVAVAAGGGGGGHSGGGGGGY